MEKSALRLRSRVLILLTAVLQSTAAERSFSIQTIAGSSADGNGGPAIEAPLSFTQGIAIDAAGSLYIADADDHRIRRVSPDGMIRTLAGTGVPGFSGDGGPAAAAQVNTPYGVAVDATGNVYIADLGNRRVRRIGSDGQITTVAGGGRLNPGLSGESMPATDAEFRTPRNVAIGTAGMLYISDFGGHRVYRVTPDGMLSAIAGTGTAGRAGDGGAVLEAQLAYPAGLALHTNGDLYIADSGNRVIRRVVRGAITSMAQRPLWLDLPTGVAVDAVGNVYIADGRGGPLVRVTPEGGVTTLPLAGRDVVVSSAGVVYAAAGSEVRRMSANGEITLAAGNGHYSYFGDGIPASQARLYMPSAIARDAAGNLYVADEGNHRVRRVSLAGVISTVAGTGERGFAGDGGLALAARLDSPRGVAVDNTGSLYIADSGNHRIRRIVGGVIVTISTQLSLPSGLALDGLGGLYVADTGNHRIRRIGIDGGIGATADTVSLRQPAAVAVDGAGNLLISDTGNNRVLRVGADGRVTTLALGDLLGPSGVGVDGDGNVYVSDRRNRIRMLATDGTVATVAGTGLSGLAGDGGAAIVAQFNGPGGVLIDPAGSIFVADRLNHRIRKLTRLPDPPVLTQGVAVSAASFLTGPVAPGEIVAILGAGIGPPGGSAGLLDRTGRLATELADTQVRFDGVPAPLFYVQERQVNVQAPYAIASRARTEVEVIHRGAVRWRASLPVAAAAPALFTQGGDRAIALHEDGSLNSSANPATRGSIVTLFATGTGPGDPPGIDGTPATAPYSVPVQPVSLTMAGYRSEILFAGAAPGFIGLVQINARIPGESAPVGTLPVELRVGASTSPPVYLVVR